MKNDRESGNALFNFGKNIKADFWILAWLEFKSAV